MKKEGPVPSSWSETPVFALSYRADWTAQSLPEEFRRLPVECSFYPSEYLLGTQLLQNTIKAFRSFYHF